MQTTHVVASQAWKALLVAAALVPLKAGAATPTLTDVDVGTPSMPGSMTVADGKITVVGGGSDIWNASDNFHYAYFKVTGDFDYIVKVESLQGNAGDGGWSKAELMARMEDPASPGVGPQGGDPHISNMTTRPATDTPATDPDTGTVGAAGVNNRGPQWRAHRTGDVDPVDPNITYDGSSSWTTPNPTYPPNMPDNWMRLERVGSVFYMYTSNDGKNWNMYNPYSPQGWDTKGSYPAGADSAAQSIFTGAWPNTIFLGLAVTAHADAYTSKAVFSNFGPYTPTAIAITKQPTAKVDISANSKLTLSVEATGDPVHYEWLKDGKAVGTNAVGATLNIPLAKTTDSGTYTVRVFGGGKEVLSAESKVSVTVDTTPPTIAEVRPLASQTKLLVTFSEPVTAATANVAANYQLSGGVTVSAAELSADAFSVTLTTSEQVLATQYTLTVTNVKDTSGLAVAAGTKGSFTSVSLLKGYAHYERWDDATGDLGDLNGFITALSDTTTPVRAPDVSTLVRQFGGPWGATDNYNSRVRTYFTPPTSGQYVFFIAADDFANVYLSTDENPANKKLICQENGWSNQYQWVDPRSGGSGALEDKRSDLCANTEWGNVITLTAGKKYYMEILHNEGGGGDGSDVTFIKAGDADPSDDLNGMHMLGDAISWFESVDSLPPVIVSEPPSTLTIPAGGTATLSVTATNPGAATLTYQWQKNGRDIPGATSKDYVIANASSADIGQYWVKVSNPKNTVKTGQGDTPTVVLVNATGVFNIEAEDFNYDGGKSKAEASVMPYTGGAYAGLSAKYDIDYHNADLYTDAQTDGHGVYRYSAAGGDDLVSTSPQTGVNIAANLDSNGATWGTTRAGAWEMTQNYKIGWISTGDWGDYTRNFPAGTYEVFAAGSYDGVAASQLNGSIGFVTGTTTATQTVEPIGIFDAPGTGAWSRNNLVRMTDAAGTPKTVTFQGGEQTIRWTYNSGDADYLLFVPAGAQPTGGFSSAKLSGSNFVIAWTGGSLETADAVTGPWTAVNGATSPLTVPVSGTKKFYRLK